MRSSYLHFSRSERKIDRRLPKLSMIDWNGVFSDQSGVIARMPICPQHSIRRFSFSN
jgi:hypothetical protein